MAVDDDLKLVVRSHKGRCHDNQFYGPYAQNQVHVTFGRRRCTTRSASAALEAGEPINSKLAGG